MTILWKSGPDPHLHRMYVQFGYHRTTSKLRRETWDLTWEEWRDIWLPHWHCRGRSADNLCLSRIDMSGDWTVHNVHLITRRELGRAIRAHYQ